MQDQQYQRWADIVPRGQPDQVAYVVPDLVQAVGAWSRLLGRDDWMIYTYGPHNTRDLQYRGRSVDYEMRLGLCGTSPQIELIESLRGPNLYTEPRPVGGGLHHVGYFVPSVVSMRARLAQAGIAPVQTGLGYGLDGDGGYAYYQLPGIDGIVEFIEVPKRRRPSETLAPVRPPTQ